VVPNAACAEAGILVVLSILLVLRTMLSIWLADVNGKIVKTIVNKDFGMFIKRVSTLFITYIYFILICN
jgi:ATP-binding cassette, subfamily D (ALD), member 3